MASLAELHNEVRWSIEAGDLKHARQRCERILSVRPDNIQTVLLLAEVDLEEHDFRTASRGFERVLRGDPESYLAYAGLGIAYEHLKNTNGAVRWYTRALDLDPANAAIREERDRLFTEAFPGRTPPLGLTRFALGRQLFQSGFRNEGVARFRTALERHPERTEIRLALAEALWAMGKSGAARELCQEIVIAEPRVVKANALLACIAAEGGDIARGRELLADVHAQDPDGFIAGDIIVQSPLAELATARLDLALEVERQEDEHCPVPGSGNSGHWVRWMRQALWTALRLIKPAFDEVAASRAGWARIVPDLDDNMLPSASAGGPVGLSNQPDDTDDRTEVIYPGSSRRRRRQRNDK